MQQTLIPTQKSVAYTLLVMGHMAPEKELGNLMEALYGKMKKHCRAYIVFRRLSTVLKRLDIWVSFLNRAIFGTPCIYRESDVVTHSTPFKLGLNGYFHNEIEEDWNERMQNAENLLSSASIVETKRGPGNEFITARNGTGMPGPFDSLLGTCPEPL